MQTLRNCTGCKVGIFLYDVSLHVQLNSRIIDNTTNQGDSACFGSKFKLSVYLIVIDMYNDFGIDLISVVHDSLSQTSCQYSE